MTKQVFVVLNPAAGRAKASEVRQSLARHFDSSSWRVIIHETKPDDPIGDLVGARVAEGVALVVAAGGDGTLSAVVDGLAKTETPVGVLPTGTTNVVAQELGIPLDLDKACRLLTGQHRLKAIDALQLGDRFFVLSVGIGLDALAMEKTSQQNKRRYGKLAYVWGISKLLMGIQPCTFTIVADGQRRRVNAADVLLTNVSTVTGPLRWGPHIAPDDGKIDIVIMRAKDLLDILGVAYDILVPSRPRRNRNLRYWHARKTILVTSDKPMPTQGDGDRLTERSLEVQICRGAVKVIVPPEPTGRRWPTLPLPG